MGDIQRNVLVAGIPKVGITSIRAALNKRCFAREGARCAEFRTNPSLRRRINASTALRAAIFRDPYARTLSLWRNLKELNGFLSRSFSYRNCLTPQGCSLLRFVQILEKEPRAKRDEHQLGQWEIARPDLMNYHFVGLLDDELDTILFWRDVMGGKRMHEHASDHVQPNASHVAPTRAILKKLYAKDYAMLRSLKLLQS